MEAEGKGNAAEINIGFYASVVRYKARLLNPAFLISVPILDNKFFLQRVKRGKIHLNESFSESPAAPFLK